MLSRVVDNLYWMSRYLERAEHTARLLDLNLYAALDQTPMSDDLRWQRLFMALRTTMPDDAPFDLGAIVRWLALDEANPMSILSSLSSARGNARQGWEQISTEMWEQLNRLYLNVGESTIDDPWSGAAHAMFTAVKQGAHLFQGVTDATMTHAEGWHFIQLGRTLERARATATLFGCYFGSYTPDADSGGVTYLEWVGLLKSCGAFESYVKLHGPQVEPERIAGFLLLNAESPRSIRFAASGIRSSLQAIGRSTGHRGAGKADRLAGRLLADLEYGQIDEVFARDLPEYLRQIEHQCDEIHRAIQETYIRYLVAPALASRGG